MTTQAAIASHNHQRTVRFFWSLLIGATMISLIGNIAHAVLPYIPRLAVQIGAAAVPPIALLAAVHGIALAVRAGASGTVYRWAVGAVAVIGVGAFTVSFLALRDLMQTIGYNSTTAWIFPAIIDTAVAVSTMMLVALGDKPARRSRTTNTAASASVRVMQSPARRTKAQITSGARTGTREQTAQGGRASIQRGRVQPVQDLAPQTAHADADLAAELITSGATTQPVETVLAVLKAHRDGASINAAAKASGINHRTAQRIVDGAAKHRRQLAAVG